MSLFSASQIHAAADGRWIELLVSAGIPAERLDGRGHPCPRCGGRDRFAAFPGVEQLGGVHCRHCFTRGSRVSPGDGISTVQWMLDCSFVESIRWIAEQLGLRDDSLRHGTSNTFATRFADPSLISPGGTNSSRLLPRKPDPTLIESMTRVARESFQRLGESQREQIARILSVSTRSLHQLRVGINADRSATTWPMRDANFNVIGIRMRSLRRRTEKWSEPGGRSGLFIPRHLGGEDTLFVTEGASDTAAATTLGLHVVGRSSCSGEEKLLADYLQSVPCSHVTIVSDNDGPGGQGARRLADSVQKAGCSVQIIVPPSPWNDLREWVAAGVTSTEVRAAEPIWRGPPICLPRQLTLQFELAD